MKLLGVQFKLDDYQEGVYFYRLTNGNVLAYDESCECFCLDSVYNWITEREAKKLIKKYA